MPAAFTFSSGDSPIVATAIHDGHFTSDHLHQHFNLNDSERLREEDPFTAGWLNITDNTIVMHHSRFETDVNRPKEKAVYLKPEDAWGLQVWKKELPGDIAEKCMNLYDEFYRQAKKYFDNLFTRHDKIIVYDIHTYNYRRDAKDAQADPAENPEVNLGTKNIDKNTWQPVVDTMLSSFQQFDYDGRKLDVRENVKFKGGYFGQWLYEQYGGNICPLSIEFKKFFMDEWTGKPFEKDIQLIKDLVLSSKKPVLEALQKI